MDELQRTRNRLEDAIGRGDLDPDVKRYIDTWVSILIEARPRRYALRTTNSNRSLKSSKHCRQTQCLLSSVTYPSNCVSGS